jgi:hypothetical protein
LEIFEKDNANFRRTNEKQQLYTLDACKVVELDLKNTLEKLVTFIFGKCEQKKIN